MWNTGPMKRPLSKAAQPGHLPLPAPGRPMLLLPTGMKAVPTGVGDSAPPAAADLEPLGKVTKMSMGLARGNLPSNLRKNLTAGLLPRASLVWPSVLMATESPAKGKTLD